MVRTIPCVCALLLAACTAGPALAWSKAGHMATGAVAYRVLKTNSPTTIPKVIAILKQNPRYAERWKQEIADLDDDADADEYLFMMAARWADDVRGDRRFYPENGLEEFHHFINKPFKPEGQPASVLTNEPAEINIVRVFPEWLSALKTQTNVKDQSIALCWVIHLAGDAHQPLHAVSLYTEKFQLKDQGRMVGDRGGTWFYVREERTSSGVSLHTIWDSLVTEKWKYRDNRNAVTKLMADPEHAPHKFAGEVAILNVEKWIDESHQLAKTKAYVFNGSLLDGGAKKPDAKVLPPGYFAVVEPVAKRRGVLAGYRIAAILKEALGN